MKLRTFFLTAAACVMLSAMSAMTALAAGIIVLGKFGL